MNSSWNLAELRSHLCDLGESKAYLSDVLNSIGRVDDVFRFHLFSARDALKGFPGAEGMPQSESFALVLGAEETRQEFALARISSESHFIGCVHAIRSMIEMYAQLVNGLKISPTIGVEFCNIYKVRDKLPESSLRVSIQEILDAYWFSYLSGLVNITKHRWLIKHEFSVAFDEDRVGLRLGAFSYGDYEYPKYWLREALQGIVDLKNLVVASGKKLNSECANDA